MVNRSNLGDKIVLDNRIEKIATIPAASSKSEWSIFKAIGCPLRPEDIEHYEALHNASLPDLTNDPRNK